MLEQVSNRTDEEIDLIELIRVLWKKKLLIAIVTFLSTMPLCFYGKGKMDISDRSHYASSDRYF